MTETTPIYEGPIEMSRKGVGFLKRLPDAEGKPQEDLIIQSADILGAFPGDLVKVESTGMHADPRTGEKREGGKVIEIITRSRETFVGKLVPDETPGAPHG